MEYPPGTIFTEVFCYSVGVDNVDEVIVVMHACFK